jgi:hypothetical protein
MKQVKFIDVSKLEVPHITIADKTNIYEFNNKNHNIKIHYTDEMVTEEFIIDYFNE